VPLVDLPLEELRAYRPAPDRRHDFATFWDETLAEARAQPLLERLAPVPYAVDDLAAHRLDYEGWNGARITCWLLAARGAVRQPTIVYYHGYSGNRGTIYSHLPWALQGYTVLAVDVRGQSGDTSDTSAYPAGHAPGYMTQGILSPRHYYYRGVYADCVRALDVAVGRPEVDPERIGLLGASQGGGLTLAVAALDARPRLAMAEIPFLCHFRRAVAVASVDPYLEIAAYCRRRPEDYEAAFETLSYFDNLNLAERVTCPVLMSVGLQDVCCPPSSIFAVFNHLTSEKEMKIFPYGGHERFPTHAEDQLIWAKRYLR